ncbi:MAG: radical SAM protein [Planctomycetota bacterium]
MTTTGDWLLLDPPSTSGYARRASTRGKDNAPPAPFPSIDLILLSGAIRQSGFAPRFLDAQIRSWNWSKLISESRALNVNGVISLVSATSTRDELWWLGILKHALGEVPMYAVAPLQLALDHATTRLLMDEHPWLNGFIMNTAENNVSELLTQPDAVPLNVAVRRGDSVVIPPTKVSYREDLRIPTPVHDIFRDPRYFFPQSKRTPVTCVQMSFGCPFTCEFCLDNALYRKACYRPADDLIAELVEIDRLGFKEAYFKDLTFGLNKRITTEFLEKLASRALELRWLCTTRIDVAAERLLGAMKSAGCYGIEFGVESGLRHRRLANGKPIEDDEIRNVFRRCKTLGLETTAFVMLGFEDETEMEIETTTRFIESLGADYVSYNVVNILPHTPLAERAAREGFLSADTSDHRFQRSNLRLRYLSPQRLQTLRQNAMRSFYTKPIRAIRRLTKTRSLFELRKLVHLGRALL